MSVFIFLTIMFVSIIVAVALSVHMSEFVVFHLYIVTGFLIATIVSIYYDFKNNFKR